jgi:hypothetical protein
MQPLSVSDLKSIAEYELERPSWQPRIIELKTRRRIRFGERLTFRFENRETVRYQIQEMLRIERIVRPAGVAEEVENWNVLVPGEGELCASMLIEHSNPEDRAARLKEFHGLENHIFLEVQDAGRTAASFDPRLLGPDQMGVLQCLRFKLTPEQRTNWSSGASLVSTHPSCAATRPLTPAEIQELAGDLR